MLTKQHFISFPICEEFVTSWYKIPCCRKVFKTKHIIVLRACLFLSIIFFFTFKTMFIYFCIRICMTLFWLPFFFSQDSLKNQILDLKRFPPTILGMQVENVWLALFCWFAPEIGVGNNCTLQFQLEDKSLGLWRLIWPNVFKPTIINILWVGVWWYYIIMFLIFSSLITSSLPFLCAALVFCKTSKYYQNHFHKVM